MHSICPCLNLTQIVIYSFRALPGMPGSSTLQGSCNPCTFLLQRMEEKYLGNWNNWHLSPHQERVLVVARLGGVQQQSRGGISFADWISFLSWLWHGDIFDWTANLTNVKSYLEILKWRKTRGWGMNVNESMSKILTKLYSQISNKMLN